MANNMIVSAEQYRELDGRLFEIKRQLRQKKGYPHNPNRLTRVLQALIEGRFGDLGKFPSEIHCPDLIPDGYEILEDVEPSKFQVKDLKLASFLHDEDGGSVNGEIMRQRAVKLSANFGLVDAQFILDHQDEIPVGFRGECLVFTGTLLRYPNGDLHVAYLRWNGARWYLAFYWLDDDWNGNDRLLHCK